MLEYNNYCRNVKREPRRYIIYQIFSTYSELLASTQTRAISWMIDSPDRRSGRSLRHLPVRFRWPSGSNSSCGRGTVRFRRELIPWEVSRICIAGFYFNRICRHNAFFGTPCPPPPPTPPQNTHAIGRDGPRGCSFYGARFY